MKPVFKCDYCNFMDTEDKVIEHEPTCIENYDRKSCYTCVNKRIKVKDGKVSYTCEDGTDIPEGKIFEFCPKYERKESSGDPLTNLFGDLFGGKL